MKNENYVTIKDICDIKKGTMIYYVKKDLYKFAIKNSLGIEAHISGSLLRERPDYFMKESKYIKLYSVKYNTNEDLFLKYLGFTEEEERNAFHSGISAKDMFLKMSDNVQKAKSQIIHYWDERQADDCIHKHNCPCTSSFCKICPDRDMLNH